MKNSHHNEKYSDLLNLSHSELLDNYIALHELWEKDREDYLELNQQRLRLESEIFELKQTIEELEDSEIDK